MPSVSDLLDSLSLPAVPCNPATHYLIKINCNPQGNGWIATLIDADEGNAIVAQPAGKCNKCECSRLVEINDIVLGMVHKEYSVGEIEKLITWLESRKTK